MGKLFNIIYKNRVKFLFILFLILILLGAFQLYNSSRYYLFAKFVESGPLYIGMPVYYKGYDIGKIKKIQPSKDYKYTFVEIIFYPKEPKLPKGIIAKAKTLYSEKKYINLVAPDEPSNILLKKGSTIDGEPEFDVEEFLYDVADPQIISALLQSTLDVMTSITKTSNEIRTFFADSRLILRDNRRNIKQTLQNLALSTKSLKKITSRFNNSITDGKLNNTTSNVDKSSTNILIATENIKNITASIDCATRNLDKTVAKIDCTLCEAGKIACNVRAITSSLREALGKRFAGLRIIFGRPINKNKCCDKCSK